MTRAQRWAGALAAALAMGLSGAARGQTTEGLGLPGPGGAPETPPAGEIEAKKLSKVPKQTKFVEAEYPKEAAEKRIEADVVLLLDINAEGKIDSVGILQPADPPGMGFDEAAMVAAQGFEFEPAEMDGKPIAVQLSYRYKFRLKPVEPVDPAPPPAGAAPAEAKPAAPPAPAREPVANLKGLLVERGTRLPLAGAIVTAFRDDPAGGAPVGFDATADENGRFQFFDLEPGDWKVLVEPPGFYPFRTTETLRAGEVLDVKYFVERGSYNPLDVTVTATRPRKEVSRTVIEAKEINTVPGAAGDPIAVVQNFAGVARAPVAGVIVVRGSAPEDTRIFVDGAEVPLIYHFGGLRSVIPIGILDSLEFYPGNFSPMYGRATGGIIDVQLKKLQPKKVGGYADVSLLDTGLFLEVPFSKNKGGVAVAARRSYIDFLINATVPDNAPVRLLTAPRYYDFQVLANYRPAPAHDLRFFFIGSDDRLRILFENPADIDTSLGSDVFSASTSFYRSLFTYKYIPNDRFENTFKISQGRNWLYFRGGQFVFDVDFYTSQIRDSVRHKLTDRLSLHYGVDLLYGRTDYTVRFPMPPAEGEPPGPPDLTQLLSSARNDVDFFWPAAYAELELRPVKGLLLLPGLRVDRFGPIHDTVVQPRLTARWQLRETLTVKGGVGFFAQEPPFQEYDRVFGNPALKAEHAIHYSAGVEYKPRPHITIDATAFYKDLDNLVSRTDRLVADETGTVRPLLYDNGGRGRVVGLELVARHDFSNKFAGWLAYTLSRSERLDTEATEWRLFDFDQTHILTAIGTYLLPRNWQIGGRFRLVSGNPRTPVVGSVFNAGTDQYDAIFGRVNSARNSMFHQLDIRVDKRWIYQRWILGLYMDIQNIYNRSNQEGLAYRFDYRQSRPQGGLPILTILGIRAEF